MTTIVLGISPRAAEALERSFRGEREPGDSALLDLIHAEVTSQLRNPTPAAVVTHTTSTTAKGVAEAMAAAGASAIQPKEQAA